MGKGYADFVNQTIQNFNEVVELIKPQSEDDPQDWLTLTFDKEAKESLGQAADKAKMTLEEFVRALVWTKVKHIQKVRKEQEERRQELSRKERYRNVNLYFDNDLIEKYESKFGQIKSKTDVKNKLKDLLLKELG